MSARVLHDRDYRSLGDFRAELRQFLAFSEAQARRAGLTPQQHQLLLAVRASASAPLVGALAERLVLRHHSTVELVDRLERRGLVRRVRAEADRRRAQVHLTARGGRVLARLTLAHRDELRRRAPSLVATLRRLTRRR